VIVLTSFMGSPQSGHSGGTGASDDMRAEITLDSAESLILIKYSVHGVVGTDVGRTQRVYRPLLALNVRSLRRRNSDAIGAKRTCRERRQRVGLTKMTQLGHRQPILL
jgi:hypothetical protein